MDINKDIKAIPVLRPLIALIAGDVIEQWVSFPAQTMLYVISALIAGLWFTLFIEWVHKPGRSWIAGFLVVMIFFCIGFFTAGEKFKSEKAFPPGNNNFFIAEVYSEPVVKNGITKIELLMNAFDSGNSVCPIIQASFQNDNVAGELKPGQIIVVKTSLEQIRGPMNEGEFDYAAYMQRRGIFYRCFIKKGEWKMLVSSSFISLKIRFLKLKNLIWNKIETHAPDNKNLGVLYALALGSKDLLTPEIRESYAATGAMHVLAVSGLHVGLIWMVLSSIFVWVRNFPAGKYLHFFIVASLIWCYAMITGMTASVVRASAMFTLVGLGKILQKESSVYNSLSVSAFFGLLFNPQWLYDPGFQLSYVAVLSIVFYQPRIVSLWCPKYSFITKIWEITSVSLAAQIGTLPLTLFYFNRFPPWFILSNLVVIPLVTIIMMGFIVLLISIPIPVLFSFILKALLFLIGVMNASLGFIEKLPSPEMGNIFLGGFEMFCFIMLLSGITFFIGYRKFNFLFMGFVSLLLFSSSLTIRHFIASKQKSLSVYSVPGKMCMVIIEGKKCVFLHNAADSTNVRQFFNYNCRPYLLKRGVSKWKILSITNVSDTLSGLYKIPGKENYFFRFQNKTILILNDPSFFKDRKYFNPLSSDIIIANSRIPRTGYQVNPIFSAGLLMISTSVSTYVKRTEMEHLIIRYDSIYDIRVKEQNIISLN